MSFIDDTISTAREIIDAASKKTTEAVEIQKLRIAIARKKSELSRAFEALGRAYYEGLSDGDMDEILAQMTETIDLTKADLKDLNNRLYAAKKMKVCDACGQRNPAGAAFCNGCGAALTADAAGGPAKEEDEE